MISRKIYTSLRITVLVACLSAVTGGFYAFVIAAACRFIFRMEERTALLWIGVPLFAAMTILLFIFLPKHFRKEGYIR